MVLVVRSYPLGSFLALTLACGVVAVYRWSQHLIASGVLNILWRCSIAASAQWLCLDFVRSAVPLGDAKVTGRGHLQDCLTESTVPADVSKVAA